MVLFGIFLLIRSSLDPTFCGTFVSLAVNVRSSDKYFVAIWMQMGMVTVMGGGGGRGVVGQSSRP